MQKQPIVEESVTFLCEQSKIAKFVIAIEYLGLYDLLKKKKH